MKAKSKQTETPKTGLETTVGNYPGKSKWCWLWLGWWQLKGKVWMGFGSQVSTTYWRTEGKKGRKGKVGESMAWPSWENNDAVCWDGEITGDMSKQRRGGGKSSFQCWTYWDWNCWWTTKWKCWGSSLPKGEVWDKGWKGASSVHKSVVLNPGYSIICPQSFLNVLLSTPYHQIYISLYTHLICYITILLCIMKENYKHWKDMGDTTLRHLLWELEFCSMNPETKAMASRNL